MIPQWTGHDGLQQVEMWKQVPPEVNGHIRIHLHRKRVQLTSQGLTNSDITAKVGDLFHSHKLNRPIWSEHTAS